MNIYFAGSIRAGSDDIQLYQELIIYLKKYGKVLTEHVGDNKAAHLREDAMDEQAIHNGDMAWLNQSNVIIAEVTQPSLGVGYEVGRIIERNEKLPQEKRKKIFCLYRPQEGKKLSAMIAGCSGLTLKEYQTIEEAKQLIDQFIKNLSISSMEHGV